MSVSKRIAVEPVRTRGFTTIGAGYLSVGDPLDHAAVQLVFINDTDVTLMISWNGVDDHQPILSGGFVQDITANKSIDGGFYAQEGQQFYVKHVGAAPSSGSFYITNYYSDEY
jgi:hypothetical protein